MTSSSRPGSRGRASLPVSKQAHAALACVARCCAANQRHWGVIRETCTLFGISGIAGHASCFGRHRSKGGLAAAPLFLCGCASSKARAPQENALPPAKSMRGRLGCGGHEWWAAAVEGATPAGAQRAYDVQSATATGAGARGRAQAAASWCCSCSRVFVGIHQKCTSEEYGQRCAALGVPAAAPTTLGVPQRASRAHVPWCKWGVLPRIIIVTIITTRVIAGYR